MATLSLSVPSRRPIRVLHVLEATLGGTLRYMENIAAATAGSDFVSAFAYGVARADSRLTPFLSKVKAMNWSLFPIDMRREINMRQDFRALTQLRETIKSFPPDIIHCHSSKAGALGRAAGALQWKSPARLYSPHALATSLGRAYLEIERVLSHHTEGFVAVSESEREEILGFSLARKNSVSVVYPIVDSEYFFPADKSDARRILGLGSGPIVLGIGRVSAQKDPLAFLEIVKRLHAKRPDLRAIWVGSDTGEVDLEAAARTAGMSGIVQLVRWQHDVRQYLAAADVLLSTSKFESFGFVTAEALSMHCPVVATNVTGTRDILTGALSKWLYPVGAYQKATELLMDILARPDEAIASACLGRLEIERRFSRSRMRDALLETYQHSLAGAPNHKHTRQLLQSSPS